jgi:hypothetical protein
MENHMTFLERYPRPWTFIECDPSQSGGIFDANGQLMVMLVTDIDWNDDGEASPRSRPVFNGTLDDEGTEEDREQLITIILAGINGAKATP